MPNAALVAALVVASLSATVAVAAPQVPQPESGMPSAELEAVTVKGRKREQVFRERMAVFGDVDFIDEGDGWRLLRMAVYPR